MNYDVAVIGGGVSGLATAYALQQRGHRVALLERQVRTGGAFLLSAECKQGQVGTVRITSLAGGSLRLANPWGGAARLRLANGTERRVTGRVLRLRVPRGEKATLTSA